MRSRVNRGDLTLGLVFMGLGVGIAVKAADLPSMGKIGVGSGLFPTITGVGMVIFGLVLAVGAVLSRGRADGGLPAAPMVRWDVLVVLGLLAGLVVLMPPVGFLVTGTVFGALAARLGGAPWLGAILFGAGATAVLYTVFVHGLGVPLPRGILGF
ncbi:MAG: tripartite tricarboxylate transporter TctB family protein [Acuticoccus sp.]